MKLHRPALAALLTAALTATAFTPLAPSAAPTDDCERRGSDLAAPCNPYAADSPYGVAHGDAYAQASTDIVGPPRAGTPLDVVHAPLPFIPIGNLFSPRYPDGSRVVWAPGIGARADHSFAKLDPATGEVIDVYHSVLDEGAAPDDIQAIQRTYGFLDAENRLWRAAGPAIEIVTDAVPGDPRSEIALVTRWQLPERALCREGDGIVGLNVDFDGNAVFVTRHGVVGVVPADPARLADEELVVHSINGARCDDPSVPLEELETTSNSVVADERGGIYPLTTDASYRFDLVGDRLRLVWRAEYETGAAGGGGVRIDRGSGSTPTLMGTKPGDDRFVVFTDGQQLMHVVLMWRDEVPADWPGLPGRDRRIACEFPITFGDPTRTASSSEQSVVVSGHAMFFPNNELANAEAFGAIPQQQTSQAAAGIGGQLPQHQPFGFERIDWDPATRTCESVWVNEEASVPNGVPYVSRGSGLVYGIGAQDGVNGLVAMDIDTGATSFFWPSGPSPTQNAFYTALTMDDDGNVWTGGLFGFTRFANVG